MESIAGKSTFLRASRRLALVGVVVVGLLGCETNAAVEERIAAEQDNATAQFNLANMYNTGSGVPQDYAEALKWYRRSADLGFAKAQFILGNIYAGMGAIHANPGSSDEDITIAIMFGPNDYAGLGVPADHAEAAKWYQKAAEQGLVNAQYQLGILYQNGVGVPLDYVQAYMWFGLVEWSNHPELQEHAISFRAMFIEQMTPGQISEAQHLLRKWR